MALQQTTVINTDVSGFVRSYFFRWSRFGVGLTDGLLYLLNSWEGTYDCRREPTSKGGIHHSWPAEVDNNGMTKARRVPLQYAARWKLQSETSSGTMSRTSRKDGATNGIAVYTIFAVSKGRTCISTDPLGKPIIIDMVLRYGLHMQRQCGNF